MVSLQFQGVQRDRLCYHYCLSPRTVKMSLNTTFDPYTTPFLPPPQGQTSHIGNPQVTKWPELLAVICVSFVITIPITVARVFTKLHIRREFKVEDCKPARTLQALLRG